MTERAGPARARAARAPCTLRQFAPSLPLMRWLPLFGLLGAACSVGQGDGYVTSDRLFVNDCWLGKFSLKPNFFAANPFQNTLTIRVQRGEQDIQVSDGFTMLVNDVPGIRAAGFPSGQLTVGLPEGVTPVGYPLPEVPHPPAASLSLYLNASCRSQNSLLSAVSGWVEFDKLFSGDPNEEDADDRLTTGTFEVTVVDPRDAIPRAAGDDSGPPFTYPPERSSVIDGGFSFVFHRGTPAQPFP
jgi:hypothetical protein